MQRHARLRAAAVDTTRPRPRRRVRDAEPEWLTCEQCHMPFLRPHVWGPPARYCCQAHRQAAYLDRRDAF